MRFQKDYIAAVVETRKSTDIFAKRLKPLSYAKVSTEYLSIPQAEDQSLFSRLKSYLGLASTNLSDDEPAVLIGEGMSKSPIVFCYSLFYVYYDQYTYITGVLI